MKLLDEYLSSLKMKEVEEFFDLVFYPRYVSDRTLPPLREYIAWLPRMLRARRTRHEASLQKKD